MIERTLGSSLYVVNGWSDAGVFGGRWGGKATLADQTRVFRILYSPTGKRESISERVPTLGPLDPCPVEIPLRK